MQKMKDAVRDASSVDWVQLSFNLRADPDWNDWRWQLANCCCDVRDLPCVDQNASGLMKVACRYPVKITPYYLRLALSAGSPLLRQCIPSVQELDTGESSCEDPFDEMECMPVPSLIHRYNNRAVVLLSTDCGVFCRHCTRKNTLAFTVPPDEKRLHRIVDYVKSRPEIRELIVSGGDPLVLETGYIKKVLKLFRSIDTVEVLRLGTRVPVVLPMRIDEELACVLAEQRPLWINTQFNHPSEITEEAVSACDLLIRHGLPVSNQSVLLRGVNDSFEVMSELCNRLQAVSVRSYYMFQCDPVRGTSHFRTPVSDGARIARAMRERLGGLSVPVYAADRPGASGKVTLEGFAEQVVTGNHCL